MKKITLFICTLVLAMSAFASEEGIDRLDKRTLKEMSAEEMSDRMVLLETRVEEIQAIDLSGLEGFERRAIKRELRYIDKEMKALGNGGIYVSTGAIIIILLLIIIL